MEYFELINLTINGKIVNKLLRLRLSLKQMLVASATIKTSFATDKSFVLTSNLIKLLIYLIYKEIACKVEFTFASSHELLIAFKLFTRFLSKLLITLCFSETSCIIERSFAFVIS